MIEYNESFKLHDVNDKITFSVFNNRLLFLHSKFTSSQLVLDTFGVMITDNINCCKVCFMYTQSEGCLGLYFEKDEYQKLRTYFKNLGFPCHEIPTLTNREI